ncbi:MAG: IPT/TIG domain-containing protein, partial [Pyrinomonadaceae bacterium]
IRIVGAGLSGEAVVVSFGATPVNLNAHPFSSQIDVAVPPSLVPGLAAVRVTVNTINSNSTDFMVLA